MPWPMKQIAVLPSSYPAVALTIASATSRKSSSVTSRGLLRTIWSKASAYSASSFFRSVYSNPAIRWVGCTTRIFTPFAMARSRASPTLSMTSPSRPFTWSMMIWLVNARRTLHSGKPVCSHFSIAPIVRRRLSLKLVPKETTSSSFSPMPSWLSGSSREASPVS